MNALGRVEKFPSLGKKVARTANSFGVASYCSPYHCCEMFLFARAGGPVCKKLMTACSLAVPLA